MNNNKSESHEDRLDLLAAYALNALEMDEVAEAERILASDPIYAAEFKKLLRVSEALSLSFEEVAPPDHLRNKVFNRISDTPPAYAAKTAMEANPRPYETGYISEESGRSSLIKGLSRLFTPSRAVYAGGVAMLAVFAGLSIALSLANSDLNQELNRMEAQMNQRSVASSPGDSGTEIEILPIQGVTDADEPILIVLPTIAESETNADVTETNAILTSVSSERMEATFAKDNLEKGRLYRMWGASGGKVEFLGEFSPDSKGFAKILIRKNTRELRDYDQMIITFNEEETANSEE